MSPNAKRYARKPEPWYHRSPDARYVLAALAAISLLVGGLPW